MTTWAILQSNGEHSENRYLRECFSVQRALRALGHDAEIFGPGHVNLLPSGRFDNILVLENYKTAWLRMGDLDGYKIHWIIDLHVRDYHSYTQISKECNLILHATDSLRDAYKRAVPSRFHRWCANCVDDRYFYNHNLNRTRDIVFVGSRLSKRQPFIDAVANRVDIEQMTVLGDEMIKIVSTAKIQFNRNLGADINYRNFETIALGTCLVTDRIAEMTASGFIDGVNCLMYSGVDEAVSQLERALSGEWERIAAAGLELSKRHTYVSRFADKLADRLR